MSSKVSRGIGLLIFAIEFLPFSVLTSLYTSISEPHSDIAVLCGTVQVQLRLIVCKSYKTGLLEL